MRRSCALLVIALLLARAVSAQESRIASDLRREKEQIAGACDSFSPMPIGECVYTLFTSSPLHVAAGSQPPQNGFAFGLAFAERWTPNESWRITWSADAVTTLAGSWRAGAYAKFIRTPSTSGVVVRPSGTPAPPPDSIAPRPVPVFDAFVQSISLETLSFYGGGMDSAREDRTIFGETQTIVGGSVLYPIGAKALAAVRPAFVGGIQLRVIDIRDGEGSFPRVDQRFSPDAAPGLLDQDPFTQFTEGIRLKPSFANGAVALNYLLSSQQFRTSASSHGSFVRWTADLRHEFPLSRRAASTGPRDFNSPNECATSAGSSACPPLQFSRNREGAITIRALVVGASVSETNQVPFYLQPTLGGSDLNGDRVLAGYDDYRYRGPNLVALQESVEHSLWGPVGAFFTLEQGAVAERFHEFRFKDLANSATVGLTLRAGGFPMVNLAFAFGGEGHHVITSMDTSLLGGSRRPSLF
jgi:hypothetical protein